MRRDPLGLRDAGECVLCQFESEQGEKRYLSASVYI